MRRDSEAALLTNNVNSNFSWMGRRWLPTPPQQDDRRLVQYQDVESGREQDTDSFGVPGEQHREVWNEKTLSAVQRREQPRCLPVFNTEQGKQIAVPQVHIKQVISKDQKLPDQLLRSKPKMVISSGNTTLIGDKMAAAFDKHDPLWLVQVSGNETFQTVLQKILDGEVTVQRKYVFIQIGSNQVQLGTRSMVYRLIGRIVQAIRQVNKNARVFFVGVLPRPIDNEQVKPKICEFNRFLAGAVKNVKDGMVKYVPIQIHFLRGQLPRMEFYQPDRVLLNKEGAAQLRKRLFEAAGFKAND